MRRRSLKWLIAQIILDAILINAAIIAAWYIRYEVLDDSLQIGEGFIYQPYSAYIPIAFVLTLLALAIFRFEGLYSPVRGRSYLDTVYILINGTTTATLLLMAFSFFTRPLVFSRALYVFAAVLIVVILGAARLVERMARAQLRQRGIGVDRVLIVGAGEVGRALMRNIVAQPDLAYRIVGFVDDDLGRGSTDIGRFKALGKTENLQRLLRELAVDEVIVTLPWTAREKIIQIMNLCQSAGVAAKIVPDLFQLSLSRVAIDDVGGVPLIGVREIRIGVWNSIVKRLIDVVGTILLLIPAAPLMLILIIAIRLDSTGSAIFAQKRIGRGGRVFTVYKFRSMRVGAEEEQQKYTSLNEADGPLFKIRNDPRRTRVGRWIRRMSLDELPQLFNVLRGEMSLVGPRPATPAEVERYQEWHKRRLEVSPGITGLWQVSGRSELTFDEQVMLDIYYIENWSPWLDFWILLKTVPTVLLARGAY
jgi:exopolysaccharide biosynthesis polyprenyl glycosylphosphotransferase